LVQRHNGECPLWAKDQIGEIGSYDFPHGIDINYGMIALTSYGNNSISITPF
jgi:hypothetical protein